MLDLSSFTNLKPVEPPPSAMTRMADIIKLKGLKTQQEAQATQQQKAAALQEILANAQWDHESGGLDQDTLQKIGQIDPSAQAALMKDYQQVATGKATVANMTVDNNREAAAAAETGRHNAEMEIPDATRQYRLWLKDNNLAPSAANELKFKTQGKVDTKFDEFTDENGQRVVVKQRPDGTTYNETEGKQGAAPRTPVPGVDIPYSPDVAAQRLKERAASKAPGATPPSEDTVNWIADQVAADNTGQVLTKFTSGDKALRDRVTEILKNRGTKVETKTAATRTKAETAGPVISQADDLISFANDPANAYIFGKIAGRWSDFMAGKIGTDDEKMAAMAPKIRSLASLLAPLHGFRSANAADEFARTMPLMDSPKAFAAAIKEYKDVAQRVANSGGGSGGGTQAATPPAPVGTVLSDGRVKQADGTWRKP